MISGSGRGHSAALGRPVLDNDGGLASESGSDSEIPDCGGEPRATGTCALADVTSGAGGLILRDRAGHTCPMNPGATQLEIGSDHAGWPGPASLSGVAVMTMVAPSWFFGSGRWPDPERSARGYGSVKRPVVKEAFPSDLASQ